MPEIEVTQIDRRYEGLRLQDKPAEQALLMSLLERGIREPLLCLVRPGAPHILLDGFKRLRCALKTGLGMVPVSSLGETESAAILQLLRISNAKRLDFLEQAALVDELHQTQGLSVSEIARQLDRSPAWVSVRLGLFGGMSPELRQAIFDGRFPGRSYMYTIRPFTRVKGIVKSDIDDFVQAVSGKGLSTRSISCLAQSYFKGGPKLREQILKGDLDWTLEQLKKAEGINPSGLDNLELNTLKELDRAKSSVYKIPYMLKSPGFSSPAFSGKARVLITGILAGTALFIKTLEDYLCLLKTEERP